ncbi:hypothetical protein B0T25DRAFT_569335 [Lasiosphaeria hispida]|uniref:Uncharacterized protein n=1 Tax=Lasiosphaeria hispida TaxID=260671 RepID=A0AAJ0HD41_9PEZI|nr:hypothetical protein B0T25DRAFT_569335 [Lasiosphaeria hispida]
MPSSRCQAAIQASMSALVFDMGRPAIPDDATLFSLLNKCFAKISNIFDLNDNQGVLSTPSNMERMLGSTFDTVSRAFVTEQSQRVLAGLDDHDKSCLFAQAVAGITMIFQRLSSTGQDVSPRLFSRELQLFAESDERRDMLDKIGASSLLSSCFTKSVMIDFVTDTIEGRETSHYEDLPLGRLGGDLLSDSVAWVSDRPCKNNGLPWGFTIMAIN